MAGYEVLHQREAAKERDWLIGTYGNSFAAAYRGWMDSLARAAAGEKAGGPPADDVHAEGVDLEKMFEEIAETDPKDWRDSWRNFLSQRLVDKIKVFLTVLKRRRPPWQTRIASRALGGLDGHCSVEVDIVYEINDPELLLVVRMVSGPQGPLVGAGGKGGKWTR
jgi:hypothetical protein